MDSNRRIMGFKQSAIPFTYRFLGLRLRLAFTKRRFERVEARYHQQLNADENRGGDVFELLETSFSSLRSEIDNIEEGQKRMKRRALPRVREALLMHESFLCFLGGFRAAATSGHDSCECLIPMLNQGVETTTAIKKLIAEFAGVPTGMLIHDLRSLESLLEHSDDDIAPFVEELVDDQDSLGATSVDSNEQ